MSLARHMLEAAARGRRVLGEAAERVEAFVRQQVNQDGGFNDRSGRSDLYYTSFGLMTTRALGIWPDARTAAYVRSMSVTEQLGLVHLASSARAKACLDDAVDLPKSELIAQIESFRIDGGGYAADGSEPTVYACFLAAGAYQDLGLNVPDAKGLLARLQSLRCDDGGFANQRSLPMGLTPPTAAAAVLMCELQPKPPANLADWLLARCCEQGGFFAMPMAPMPDLLSTAVALHALRRLGADVGPIRECCLDFIDSLWSPQGSFLAHAADDALDVEYCFYGLLALGELAE